MRVGLLVLRRGREHRHARWKNRQGDYFLPRVRGTNAPLGSLTSTMSNLSSASERETENALRTLASILAFHRKSFSEDEREHIVDLLVTLGFDDSDDSNSLLEQIHPTP